MAYTEKNLFELCKKIKDAELRKRVEDFIKNLAPSHSDFKIALSLDKVPAAPISRLTRAGGMIQHTVSVVELCEFYAKHIEKVYGVKMNADYVVAAAILHDLYKAVEFGQEAGQYVSAEFFLNHLNLMIAELYARGFPKELIHIIAAHFGENSPTPPLTYEALCLYWADSFATVIETNVSRTEELEKQLALVLMPPKSAAEVEGVTKKEKSKKR